MKSNDAGVTRANELIKPQAIPWTNDEQDVWHQIENLPSNL